MKKLLALLLTLLLTPAALAEFDNAALEAVEDYQVLPPDAALNTVVRPLNQPYLGESSNGQMMAVYVDFVELVDAEATLPRLLASLTLDEPMQADTMVVTVNKKVYSFAVTCDQTEYDGIFMEDYAVCLAKTSLPLLKDLAKQKREVSVPFVFLRDGQEVLSGQAALPGGEMKALYDKFVALGGTKQPLDALDEMFPCQVKKGR